MIRETGSINMTTSPDRPHTIRTKNMIRDFSRIKKRIVPLMAHTEKSKGKKFANRVRTNFKQEDTLKILFSDEKMLDIDGV